ncbi:hypothetical protein U1Q18_007547 [Sarracenia purpurea var. burkii]
MALEDGWVVCRVFKKKNLFKVGNGDGAYCSNSMRQDQVNSASNCNPSRTLTHRDNQYLLRHQHIHGSQQTFDLYNKSEIALNHIPVPYPPHTHTQTHIQEQNLIPTHKLMGYDYLATPSDHSPIMVKLLMSNPRDCESGSQHLRYQACEPGLEVETLDLSRTMVNVSSRDENLNEWGMLDRVVTPHLSHEDSSKGVRFEDATTSSMHQMNQLSLRGEMDFWGYGK